MFEKKLIRHPYGIEEILIVDGAALRPHDLPHQVELLPLTLQLKAVMEIFAKEAVQAAWREMMTIKASRELWLGKRVIGPYPLFRIPIRFGQKEPVPTV